MEPGPPKAQLLVKLLSENAQVPTKSSPNASGYDLFSSEEIYVPAKGMKVVKTGVALAIPKGNDGRIGISRI